MGYQPGSFGYEAQGKRLRIFEAWIAAQQRAKEGRTPFPFLHAPGEEISQEDLAQEAMSVSDFPTYMTKIYRHTFLGRFEEISGQWPRYTRSDSLPDFETYTASRFGRFPNWPEKTPGAPYTELALGELPGPSINLREWGAAFSLTRKLILSDRLDKITDLPVRFAEAAARTKSTVAVIDTFQSNPTMWDGNLLISSAHGNIGATALTADIVGMNALIAADLALGNMTDDEGYKITTPAPRTLLIPTAYRYVVKAMQSNPQLWNGTYLQANLAQTLTDNVIEEPYFTDSNNWYLLSDPNGPLSPLVALSLNGETTPFIGRKNPEVTSLQGGTDPYTFDFDELEFKGRDDYNFIATEWRGIYGAIVP